MTEPLNQKVAERYGYNKESFRGWTKKYVDSLKLETLNFKPTSVFSFKYVIEPITWPVSKDKYLILNPGYIYLLESKAGRKTHYIPVSEPFHHQNQLQYSSGLKMNGLYVVKKDEHTYTTQGFNTYNNTIIGVAPFPKIKRGGFLNWNGNPLP